jgi:excisionase family DNA binding protein
MQTAPLANDTSNLQPMLTAQQVAALLSLSLRRFEQMVATGQAPRHVRVGRLRRWHQADVKAWMDRLTDDAAARSAPGS